MTKDAKKALLYVYVESDFPAEEDGWKKTNIELDIGQKIQKLSWRTSEGSVNEFGSWGSNNITTTTKDLNALVGQLLTMCDAMLADKDQRDAWKQLIRSTVYKWHDEKDASYRLEARFKGDKFTK